MYLLSQLWSLLGSVLLIIGVYIVAQTLPKYQRVIPDSGYRDVETIPRDETSPLDATVDIEQLHHGDLIAYRIHDVQTDKKAFGYVIGLPGEVVSFGAEAAEVGGQPVSRGRVPRRPGRSEWMPVPADHVYVLSDRNQLDSTALGPIPGARIMGRIKE